MLLKCIKLRRNFSKYQDYYVPYGMKGSMSIYILYCPLKFLSMTVSCYTKQTVTNKLFEMHKIKNNFEQKYVLILNIST